MSIVVSAVTSALASPTVTSSSSIQTNLVATLTSISPTQKKAKTKTKTYIRAGDSGVLPSSSLVAADASGVPLLSASSASPQYKTVYVTRTAEPNSNAGSPALQPGAIAGIAVGGVVFLALVVGLVYCILRKRRRKVIESADVPRSSGSQTTFVAEKDDANVSELYGSQRRPVYEASSKVVYEMEAPLPELEGRAAELEGRSFSLESEQSPTTPTIAQSRHIMSRGRPIRGKKG